MTFLQLFVENVLNFQLLCFLFGLLLNTWSIPKRISTLLTLYLLFAIGLKGGSSLAQHLRLEVEVFALVVGFMVLWGFLHPFISFIILKYGYGLDVPTAAAIAACFGSVSVMTFIAATSFLDRYLVSYQGFMVAILAIMEVPAIISGIFLAHIFQKERSLRLRDALQEAICNKALGVLLFGLSCGGVLYHTKLEFVAGSILWFFKPFLSLFLLEMGMRVGRYKALFQSFSYQFLFQLVLFGIFMPFVGGVSGVFYSAYMHLDVGTATLIAVLLASASYIAVPAAMRLALPYAQESIYLPLSLGITFPFNVMVGVPLYYYLSTLYLS